MAEKILKKFGQISKDTWNQLAKEDAEYYILSDKSKKGGMWDKESFLSQGIKQWAGFKKMLGHYNLEEAVGENKKALDSRFGITAKRRIWIAGFLLNLLKEIAIF